MGVFTRIGDTLLNFVTGLGTLKDPRTSTQLIYRELDRNVLEQMYRSDWLARRLVDLPAEDATREWRQWAASRPQLEKLDALEKKLKLQQKMRQALQRARLYGGAALVLGVDQGNPEDELDLDEVGLGDLKWVVVCNRYELAAGPRIFNVDSDWYTRPEYYTVATPMFGFYGEEGGAYPSNPKQAGAPISADQSKQVQPGYGMVRVHPSRVIEFTGHELPDWRLAPMGGGWGDSVLQTINDSLRDFAMITSGLASLINDMKMDVVKVPDLSRKLSTDEITRKTLERFGLANMAKSSINTLLLDKEEEWDRIQTSFGSTPELIKVCMTIACAAGGVPESRVMGNAPNKGLASTGNSGGEVDIRNYYDDVMSKQKSQYTPMMVPLDRCVQQSALGRYDPSIDYEWNPLYQPTAAELAAVGLQKAQTTQVYVTTGLINEDALREAVISQLTEDNIYPGLEDALDEFGSEPEEPPAPMQQMPPNAPPGFVPKGQFEPNPFHMLRAQQQAKSGQPIKVPPNRPPGAPKFFPLPKGAQKDEWLGDYDPNEARDPAGMWTSGDYGLVPGDVEKFHALKDDWAKVNNHLLSYVDKPDSAEAQADTHELERIVKEMHGLHADPGTAEGIGLPGGPRDVTIVGAGPGGLAASIFGGAEGLDTLLVESSAVAGGQARYSSRIENFPGFPVGVTGEKLTKDMFEQAERLGAEEELGVRVTGLEYDEKTGLKRLSLSDGQKIVTRSVILAGGVEFRKPGFPGAEGSGVVVGDGKTLTEKAAGGDAVVIGGSNGAAQAALGAATKASHVYLISRSALSKGMSDYQVEAVHNQPKITVIEEDSVAKVNRDAAGNCVSIDTVGGKKVPCKALGVFLGSVPETGWLGGEVKRDAAGRVATDAKLETNIPGVFAVGDMREGAIGRIGVAVGEGQLALREANVYLEGLKPKKAMTTDGVRAFDADNVDDLIGRLFDLDRANPYFGSTVEDVKPGRHGVHDFNPYHDPDSGRFTSGERLAHKTGEQAVSSSLAGLAKKAPSAARSAAAKAAHAARAAHLREAFPISAGASPENAGVAAVARLFAAQRLSGKPVTKGEMSEAAKADIKTAALKFAETMNLKEPVVPEGVSPDVAGLAMKTMVRAQRFVQDSGTRQIVMGKAKTATMAALSKTVHGLPAHALEVAHSALIDWTADHINEIIANAAATAVSGVVGTVTVNYWVGAAAFVATKAEVQFGLDKLAKHLGLSPDDIKEHLYGLGGALENHYHKFRDVYLHTLFADPHTPPRPAYEYVDADGDGFDPIDVALKALGEVLGE